MAGDLQQRLDSLKGKAQLIIKRYALLEEENASMRQRISDLEKAIERQERELTAKDRQIEQLRMMGIIAPGREDVEKSRAFLAGLVRDIDKCINELKE
jgi:septal ring factor EnvC (AmiA/AmiB activator)